MKAVRIVIAPVIAIIALGLLVGATLTAPGAGAATYYTRSASCAGLSFFPDDSRGYDTDGTLRYRPSPADAWGTFRCNPGLPNGAIVTKLQFTVRDAETFTGFDVTCWLARSGLAATTTPSDVQHMAGPLVTTGAPGTVRLTTSAISYATIDNANHGYWVECNLPPKYFLNDIGIFGADVIYKITAAKG
jgi:hypothetical protein